MSSPLAIHSQTRTITRMKQIRLLTKAKVAITFGPILKLTGEVIVDEGDGTLTLLLHSSLPIQQEAANKFAHPAFETQVVPQAEEPAYSPPTVHP